MTSAEQNKYAADEYLETLAETSNIRVSHIGLWQRDIYVGIDDSTSVLVDAAIELKQRFGATVKYVFYNNLHAYTIELPRIIID